MYPLLFLALLQASAAVEPVRSGCASDDPQIASAAAGDQVQVETARAGDEQTCYRIVLTKPGQSPVTGYVLGEGLPAIAVFIHRRERASEEAARADAQAARIAQQKKAAPGEPVKSADPLVSTEFEDFSGKEPNGKPVSLARMKGPVTLVTFWSPARPKTIDQLKSVVPIYNEFHESGLNAVGVSMDPDGNHLSEALDDFNFPWPQMPDRSGLANRYQVDPRAGKTFVLDASHRIVATGPIMGPDIVKAIRQLLATPENQ